jgi:hypothetical protein
MVVCDEISVIKSFIQEIRLIEPLVPAKVDIDVALLGHNKAEGGRIRPLSGIL